VNRRSADAPDLTYRHHACGLIGLTFKEDGHGALEVIAPQENVEGFFRHC
jgi:hypothetical protein